MKPKISSLWKSEIGVLVTIETTGPQHLHVGQDLEKSPWSHLYGSGQNAYQDSDSFQNDRFLRIFRNPFWISQLNCQSSFFFSFFSFNLSPSSLKLNFPWFCQFVQVEHIWEKTFTPRYCVVLIVSLQNKTCRIKSRTSWCKVFWVLEMTAS